MSKTLSTAAVAAFALGVAAWPVQVRLRNTVWRPFAEAVTGAEVAGEGGVAVVSVPDEGTLYRMVQNVEQNNFLAGWKVDEGAGVFVEVIDPEEGAAEAKAEAERQAAEAEAKAKTEAEAQAQAATQKPGKASK